MANLVEAFASELQIAKDYHKDFDSECYLQMYYGNPPDEDEGHFLKFALDGLHSAFSSGKIKGKCLLDMGSGPSIHSVISASPHVDSIYLSDYTEQNRNILKSWWKNEKTYEQHMHVLKYVTDLENKGESVQDRNTLIRQKVKNIVPIDVTLPNPLQTKDIPQTYDIITSSLCLESPSTTREGYEKSVKYITPLIKQGGFLVIVGVLNETCYPVGKYKFMCVSLTKDELQEIYKKSGYNIVSWRDFKNSEYKYGKKIDSPSDDFEIEFVMVAEKM